MLTVVRSDCLVDGSQSTASTAEWTLGITAREAVSAAELALWPESPEIAFIVNGEDVGPDAVLEDGDFVNYGPRPHGLEFLVKLIVLAAINLLAARLTKKQVRDPDGIDAQQDDPAFRWNGIQTTYGDGYYAKTAVGTGRVSGHVTSQSVDPQGRDEILTILFQLGYGPFHSIGGVYTDADLEPLEDDGFNPPVSSFQLEGVQINGITIDTAAAENVQARSAVRLGSINQQPMPFDIGIATAIADSSFDLVAEADSVIVAIPDTAATRAQVQIDFRQGLARQNGDGTLSPLTVDFLISWRRRSVDATFSMPTPLSVTASTREPFQRVLDIGLDPGSPPPDGFDGFEVRVLRTSPDSNPSSSQFDQSIATVSRIVYSAGIRQSYPGKAYFALILRADAQFSGGQPQVSVPAETRRVRVYDDVLGISDDRYFDFPAAGDPFEGIWSTVRPGDNPAWQAMELITAEDFGAPLRLRPVYSLFRDWADWCDEMDFRSFYEFAQPENVWDALQATVMQAGRAILVKSGSEVFPVYWSRDAHGRGANVVPARSPKTVLAVSNVESWTVTFSPTHQAPNTLTGQIRDEDAGYEIRPVVVTDPSVNTSDVTALDYQPLIEQSRQLPAIPSRTQATRHLWWMLQGQRLQDRELVVQCGISEVYFGIGENFLFQADKYRPLAEGSVNWGGLIAQDTPQTDTALVLNKALEVPASTHYQAAVHAGDTVVLVQLTLVAGTYAAGDPVPLRAGHSLPRDLPKDAVVMIGERDTGGDPRAGQEFTCIEKTTLDQFRVRIKALRYVPEVYDEPPASVLAGAVGTVDPPTTTPGPLRPDVSPGIFDVQSVGLAIEEDGSYTVGFTSPLGMQGREVRVEGRRNAGDRWELLGRTTTNSIRVPAVPMDTDNRVDLRIVPILPEAGGFPAPIQGYKRVHVPEFVDAPIAAPERLQGFGTGDAIYLAWDQVPGAEYYEVRRGEIWDGAPVIARTNETEVRIENVPAGAVRYHVRARRRRGGWSPSSATVEIDWAGENDVVEFPDGPVLAEMDLEGMELDADGNLELSDGVLTGTATGTFKSDGPLVARWLAEVDYHESMPGLTVFHPLGSLDFSTGEGHYRGTLTREPSSRYPGVDLAVMVDDVDSGTVSPTRSVRGGVGQNTRVDLEVRFSEEGDDNYGEWEPYRPQRRRAEFVQVRAVCRRRSSDYQLTLTRFTAQGTT